MPPRDSEAIQSHRAGGRARAAGADTRPEIPEGCGRDGGKGDAAGSRGEASGGLSEEGLEGVGRGEVFRERGHGVTSGAAERPACR